MQLRMWMMQAHAVACTGWGNKPPSLRSFDCFPCGSSTAHVLPLSETLLPPTPLYKKAQHHNTFRPTHMHRWSCHLARVMKNTLPSFQQGWMQQQLHSHSQICCCTTQGAIYYAVILWAGWP
jgi:hypothetical protein